LSTPNQRGWSAALNLRYDASLSSPVFGVPVGLPSSVHSDPADPHVALLDQGIERRSDWSSSRLFCILTRFSLGRLVGIVTVLVRPPIARPPVHSRGNHKRRRSLPVPDFPLPITFVRRADPTNIAVALGPSLELPSSLYPRIARTMARLSSALRASALYGLLAASCGEAGSPAPRTLRQRAPHVVTAVAEPNPTSITAVSECHLHGTVQYVVIFRGLGWLLPLFLDTAKQGPLSSAYRAPPVPRPTQTATTMAPTCKSTPAFLLSSTD
jgi:hypothetical protein